MKLAVLYVIKLPATGKNIQDLKGESYWKECDMAVEETEVKCNDVNKRKAI